MGIERRIGGGGESFDLTADHTFTGDVEFSENVEINGQKIQNNSGNLDLRSGSSAVTTRTSGGVTTSQWVHDTCSLLGGVISGHAYGSGNNYFRPTTADTYVLGGVGYEWLSIHGKEIIATDIQQLPAYTETDSPGPERPAAAVAGRVIWNLTDSKPNYDTGSAWVEADGTAA
tara:strand:- start:1062 stop:1580 length:519 start_codon:yes stop_codon:yes gene_type:complete